MNFVIKNTKSNEVRTIDLEDVKNMFWSDRFYNANILAEDFDKLSKEQQEAWMNGRATSIYNTQEEYFTNMVEEIVWSSPSGDIIPEFKVLEVKS